MGDNSMLHLADSISVYLGVSLTLWSARCLHKNNRRPWLKYSCTQAGNHFTFSKKIESCNCPCSIDFHGYSLLRIRHKILPLEEMVMAVEITGSWGPMQHFSVRRNRCECSLRRICQLVPVNTPRREGERWSMLEFVKHLMMWEYDSTISYRSPKSLTPRNI